MTVWSLCHFGAWATL